MRRDFWIETWEVTRARWPTYVACRMARGRGRGHLRTDMSARGGCGRRRHLSRVCRSGRPFSSRACVRKGVDGWVCVKMIQTVMKMETKWDTRELVRGFFGPFY